MASSRAAAASYRGALGLAWLSDSGCHSVLRLLARQGPEDLWNASTRSLVRLGMTPGAAARFGEKRRRFVFEQAAAVLERKEIRFVPYGSHLYPQELSHLSLPPAGLFVRAHEDALERFLCVPRVTIVGTRKATFYGSRVAEAFASAFAAEGVAVVSGMALGIDACAHEATLRAGDLTVAVLGCGVDVVYPRRHASLYRKIGTTGVVASELPPGTPPSRWTFPHRNRLLAALGDAVLVVEASRTSGALQTADWALELGRPVFSVPGPVLAAGHEGCNMLLYNGACPAVEPSTTVEDFIFVTRMERGERRRVRRLKEVEARAGGRGTRSESSELLDGRKRSILDALQSEACSVDDLMERTGLPVRELTAALAELELMGRTARAGPGLHIRAP